MPVGASSFVHVIAPETVLVASLSFAIHLNRDGDGQIGDNRPFSQLIIVMIGTLVMILIFGEGGESDGVEDVLRDDDDVEPATINEDSNDDLGRSIPVRGGGTSSLETQQYLPHFSTLDLEAMTQQELPNNKEEVVLSVKTYSICRGVEYRVLESNRVKYYGKCKEFINGCTWLIRITLRQQKGSCKVRWYNRPHTCMPTLISSDHRMLDYHVISTFMLPMIRADVAMSIKVLQNVT
ncbi:uncharacterized protein LOC130957750 [Arachis stenosperma]|uniref:uncharacterized protein LOC130957750 n=1 Tax=Arachis stenosperma TaxID=217475 RepID=UPI0025ACA0EE|nr:uncharacterized protein LOC130957750 [Arachis stenosperma]